MGQIFHENLSSPVPWKLSWSTNESKRGRGDDTAKDTHHWPRSNICQNINQYVLKTNDSALDVAKPSIPALNPNSSIPYEFQWFFCKHIRYASPRSEYVSGYKSAAHTPDSEPSADFSTVTLDGNGMKVIDQDQKTMQTSSEHPVAPSMAKHMHNTCPLNKQGGTCAPTHQRYHRTHTGESINIWPL